MLRKSLSLLLPFVIYLLIAGCGNAPQFQEHVNIPGNSWNKNFQPDFHFEIKDTAAPYQLVFLVRHTDNYPYNNIWLMMETQSPGDTVFQKMKVELQLAAATGQWLGRGMGELYEQAVGINTTQGPAFFHKKGLYTIRLSQIMRVDPLPDVLQIGLRVTNLHGTSRN